MGITWHISTMWVLFADGVAAIALPNAYPGAYWANQGCDWFSGVQ